MKRFIFVVTLALFIFLPDMANSAEKKIKVTGIYSDMSYNREGGDVLGLEIFLVFSRQGYFVILQVSEGEPNPPVIVPAKIQGSAITFSLPVEADPRGEFQGTINDAELSGTFKNNGQTVHLKRKNSYWQ